MSAQTDETHAPDVHLSRYGRVSGGLRSCLRDEHHVSVTFRRFTALLGSSCADFAKVLRVSDSTNKVYCVQHALADVEAARRLLAALTSDEDLPVLRGRLDCVDGSGREFSTAATMRRVAHDDGVECVTLRKGAMITFVNKS